MRRAQVILYDAGLSEPDDDLPKRDVIQAFIDALNLARDCEVLFFVPMFPDHSWRCYEELHRLWFSRQGYYRWVCFVGWLPDQPCLSDEEAMFFDYVFMPHPDSVYPEDFEARTPAPRPRRFAAELEDVTDMNVGDNGEPREGQAPPLHPRNDGEEVET